MNLYESFFVRPTSEVLVETVVHIKPDARPALVGKVLDETDKPIDSALVLISQTGEDDALVGAAYTDALGQFALAPLEAGKLYMVRIYKNCDKTRKLER